MKCIFCGNNAVVVRFIFLEMHFVVIIIVIISYVLKKEKERGQGLCENTKGGDEPKKLRSTALESTALR